VSIDGFTGLYIRGSDQGVGLVYSGGLGPLEDQADQAYRRHLAGYI